MANISDIKIIGIDEQRPPVVRKEAYIDLFFQLSLQAPADWCEDFNKLGNQITPPVKIKPGEGVFLETYVRDVEHIQDHLNKIKEKIRSCSDQYLQKEKQRLLELAAKNAELHGGVSAKQNALNLIIAGLNYETCIPGLAFNQDSLNRKYK